jgi:DNA end-binding protein Ku
MRFADEVLSFSDLSLPDDDLADIGVGKRELDMAQRLVEEMTEEWKPEQYTDSYRDDLLRRVDEKIAAGETHLLTPAAPAGEEGSARGSADVIDLAAMLKRSIEERAGGVKKDSATKSPTARKASGKSTVTELAPRSAARKAPASAAKKPPKAKMPAKTSATTETRRKHA